MIQTQTQIGTSLRLQLITFQLLVVDKKTVDSTYLREVVEYCVPRKCLGGISVCGVCGGTVHARYRVSIDYGNDGSRIKLRTDYWSHNASDGTGAGDKEECAPLSDSHADQFTCQVWNQAIEWFVRLCEEKGLELKWTVTFCRDRDEMCKRFGLGPPSHVDKTLGTECHIIPNTQMSELTAGVLLDPEMYPEEGREP